MKNWTVLQTRDWVERVRAVAPIVERWRDVGEQQRQMPQPLFDALRDAGFFKMSVPTAFGGDQLGEVVTLRVIEELSRLDGAVGWNVMIATGNAIAAICLPQPAAAPLVAAVGLGIARAAIDAFAELATTKTGHAGTTTLARQQTVHARVGRAEALVRAARAYLYQTVRESSPASTGEGITEQVSADVRLACAHATQCAAEAVDLMFTAGGISSVYSTYRLDRCFRDVHMVTQHVQVAPSNIEMVGQYLLGLGLELRR
jgi:alkylation response protein AidB-like acyl-CoA dehydrogenase